jgi:uncharacterized protein (DUF3084 family)
MKKEIDNLYLHIEKLEMAILALAETVREQELRLERLSQELDKYTIGTA